MTIKKGLEVGIYHKDKTARGSIWDIRRWAGQYEKEDEIIYSIYTSVPIPWSDEYKEENHPVLLDTVNLVRDIIEKNMPKGYSLSLRNNFWGIWKLPEPIEERPLFPNHNQAEKAHDYLGQFTDGDGDTGDLWYGDEEILFVYGPGDYDLVTTNIAWAEDEDWEIEGRRRAIEKGLWRKAPSDKEPNYTFRDKCDFCHYLGSIPDWVNDDEPCDIYYCTQTKHVCLVWGSGPASSSQIEIGLIKDSFSSLWVAGRDRAIEKGLWPESISPVAQDRFHIETPEDMKGIIANLKEGHFYLCKTYESAGIKDHALLLPNSFLEKFEVSDKVSVAGERLYESWGSPNFSLNKGGGGLWFDAYNNDYKLPNHRLVIISSAKEEAVQKALDELDMARKFERATWLNVQEI